MRVRLFSALVFLLSALQTVVLENFCEETVPGVPLPYLCRLPCLILGGDFCTEEEKKLMMDQKTLTDNQQQLPSSNGTTDAPFILLRQSPENSTVSSKEIDKSGLWRSALDMNSSLWTTTTANPIITMLRTELQPGGPGAQTSTETRETSTLPTMKFEPRLLSLSTAGTYPRASDIGFNESGFSNPVAPTPSSKTAGVVTVGEVSRRALETSSSSSAPPKARTGNWTTVSVDSTTETTMFTEIITEILIYNVTIPPDAFHDDFSAPVALATEVDVPEKGPDPARNEQPNDKASPEDVSDDVTSKTPK